MEVKNIKLTKRAKTALYNAEREKEFLDACGQKIIDFCTKNNIEPIITGVYMDELEAITLLGDELGINYDKDDEAVQAIYDVLIEDHKLYPIWEDDITVDFRRGYPENDDYLELTEAIRHFVRTQTDINRNLTNKEEVDFVNQLFSSTNSEIQLLGKVYNLDIKTNMGEDYKLRFSIDSK